MPIYGKIMIMKKAHSSSKLRPAEFGVVGWCEGGVYLTSPGRPTDISLQLGRLAVLVAGKG